MDNQSPIETKSRLSSIRICIFIFSFLLKGLLDLLSVEYKWYPHRSRRTHVSECGVAANVQDTVLLQTLSIAPALSRPDHVVG